jgi:hypothetical protein
VSFSGAANADFPGIPAGVNNLYLALECAVSSDGANLNLRTYGADGNLDAGAADYAWWARVDNSGAAGVNSGTGSASVIQLAGNVDNGNTGLLVKAEALNIQNTATRTKFIFSSVHLDAAAIDAVGRTGFGERIEADRITGISIFIGAGTITGRATLFAST